jgi:6-phospho-beta-glucosidase
VDGVDQLPSLLRDHLPELAAQVALPAAVLSTLESVPSYYLRYFYAHDEVVREEAGQPTRGQRVAQIEAELLAMYPSLDTKPALLAERGGAFYSEAAVGLLASLFEGDGAIHSANVRNRGTLPFLGDDAVIEVSCRVDRDGAVPVPLAPVAPLQAGLIAHVSAYEELAVAAAVHGGRSRVYQAMLAHPLIGQHELAEPLTDKLLAANAAFLEWAR